VSSSQAVQLTEVTQVDLMGGIQAAHPAAAAELAGQQPKKRGRPKGSKDKQPRLRKRKTGRQAGN
jgi:hypothetical protein